MLVQRSIIIKLKKIDASVSGRSGVGELNMLDLKINNTIWPHTNSYWVNSN